jgi:hypothetical protein
VSQLLDHRPSQPGELPGLQPSPPSQHPNAQRSALRELRALEDSDLRHLPEERTLRDLQSHRQTLVPGLQTAVDPMLWLRPGRPAPRWHYRRAALLELHPRSQLLAQLPRLWSTRSIIIDTETRWHQARWLLHDETLKPEDRVAGLLVLLYAQWPAAIGRLSLDQVQTNGNQVTLRLGREPVVLPQPLNALVLPVVAARQGHAAIGNQGSSPWLFPGGQPGRPISAFRLAERLRELGIQSKQSRSTALFQLATELPAALLASMLGIHITVAVAWQRASSGDWTSYAAQVSRNRSDKRTCPTANSSRRVGRQRGLVMRSSQGELTTATFWRGRRTDDADWLAGLATSNRPDKVRRAVRSRRQTGSTPVFASDDDSWGCVPPAVGGTRLVRDQFPRCAKR